MVFFLPELKRLLCETGGWGCVVFGCSPGERTSENRGEGPGHRSDQDHRARNKETGENSTK